MSITLDAPPTWHISLGGVCDVLDELDQPFEERFVLWTVICAYVWLAEKGHWRLAHDLRNVLEDGGLIPKPLADAMVFALYGV